MCCVLCTVYSAHWTVYCVQCTVYRVLCTMHSSQCTVYSVLCTVYFVLCTVYCVLCTMCCVLCTVYCLLCTVYSELTRVLISPCPDQEGNKLQRQKILSFIYIIYNHNWRNISTIYIYITRLVSNEIFSPSNKIYREVGRAKDLSAPLYTWCICVLCMYLRIKFRGYEEWVEV